MRNTADTMHTTHQSTLTTHDHKRHIPHVITVDAPAARLHIRLRFDPATVDDVRNMLTLTVFDPDGFRGAGHRGGNDHAVTIGPATATPGYRPGPVPAGDWLVQVDTHMIYGDAPVAYTLEVWTEDGSEEDTVATPPPRFDTVARDAPGWYRGDLHAHTVHSDAAWTADDLLADARRRGLDFVTLSDHNTVSGLADFAARATPALLTMGGLELTTFWGHALVLGTTTWVDWRVDAAGAAMAGIAAASYAADRLFIIAHPQDVGDPFCTGCRWLYPEMMPGTARLVEIWNGSWRNENDQFDAGNEYTRRLWFDWLNAGHVLFATAGTDVHGHGVYKRADVGFNVVYAENLSQAAILAGIAAGRSYLSCGPSLILTATGDGVTVGTGQRVAGAPTLRVAWDACPPGATLHVLARGREIARHTPAPQGEFTVTHGVGTDTWFVAELRGTDGALLAITNPIFAGPD